jgi:hypothetical protein
VEPAWKITNQKNEEIFNGTFDQLNLPIGNCLPIGNIEISLIEITSPSQLTLTINIKGFENDWDFWVYPTKHEAVGEIMVTSSLSKSAMTKLANGGSVLWSIPKSARSKNLNDGIGFSSIFWNTAWTKGQKPHSLGILCNPDHPALAEFPTDYHSNWQWWDAMSYSNGLILDDFSEDLKPVIRVIDDWFQNRNQALMIEVKIGTGKLLISGVDFFENIEDRPAGKQLLFSLKKYMSSKAFNPGVELTIEELREKLS